MGYPKEVYDKAWESLSARAAQARERERLRREEIRRAIPEITRIEKRMGETAASVAKAIVARPDEAERQIAKLQAENLALQEQRSALLAGKGYPEDYLRPQHGCADCRDSGFVGPHMCHCLKDLLKKAAYAQLGEVSQARQSSFDAFSLAYYPQQPVDASGVIPRQRMGQILAVCQQYAEQFDPRSDSLLLLGHTGLGKTHLSLAIAGSVTEKGYGVVYTPVQKLMDRLESEKFSRSDEKKEQYTDHLEMVLSCDLLVLDDLGTEFYTQFTASVLYNIINTRLIEERPTIISTNLELAQIEEKYSQRMVSRLVCSYKVLKFYGKDIRFVKKSEQR